MPTVAPAHVARDVDRVMSVAHQLELAQQALRDDLPPGTTVDELIAAYTYVLGRIVLVMNQGNVPAAAKEGATIGRQLVRVITHVLAPVYPGKGLQ